MARICQYEREYDMSSSNNFVDMSSTKNFIDRLVIDKSAVDIYISSGLKFNGYIGSHDDYSIILNRTDHYGKTKTQLIFKNMISTIQISNQNHPQYRNHKNDF
jgi:RNA chaperone Hfq